MARDIVIAREGKVNVAGDLYGKYIYPADSVSVANTLEISDEDFAAMTSTNDTTMNEPVFWQDFQNKGARTDYSYAFANWNATTINPIYGMNNVDKCMYALMNCSELLDGRTLTFNITSSNPNMMYVCANCSKMVHGPQFIFTAPVIRTYTSMYASCVALKSATVYWGDGSADPIATRNSCQNMFFKCKSLESIDFGAEKTGSPIYLDLSYSSAITADTMLSLARSLKDVSSATSGNYDITISTQTDLSMPDSTRNIFTSKGWTIKTK